MKYKIVSISILCCSLIQASIVEYGNNIFQSCIQSISNPKNYISFAKNNWKLVPGQILGISLNKNDQEYSTFNDLVENLHKETKKPLFSFFREEGICQLTQFASCTRLAVSACISPHITVIYGINKVFLHTVETIMSYMRFLPTFEERPTDNLEKRAAKTITRASIALTKAILETIHFLARFPRTTIHKLSYKLIGEENINQKSEKKWQASAILFAGLTASVIQNAYFKEILSMYPLTNKLINIFPDDHIFSIISQRYNQ